MSTSALDLLSLFHPQYHNSKNAKLQKAVDTYTSALRAKGLNKDSPADKVSAYIKEFAASHPELACELMHAPIADAKMEAERRGAIATGNNQFLKDQQVVWDSLAAAKAGSVLTLADFAKYADEHPEVRSALHRLKTTVASAGAGSGKAHKRPMRVSVTGAAGAISYSILFRIAAGEMLGHDQPVILQCLELPQAMKALEGVAMELRDCAFPLLADIELADKPEVGFKDTEFAMLVGARPRGPGMERGDLLKVNAKIFSEQGAALNKVAARNVRVTVVGNPANTNCLIAMHNAPDLPAENFTAMTRLDHNRALGMLALKTNSAVDKIERLAIWGNHSPTMYTDLSHTTVDGQWAKKLVDDKWIVDTYIPEVGQRGAAIIKARGASSAASAASAAIDHVHDWVLGTNGKWTSMAVPSDGSYGIDEGLIYSIPVICEGGEYHRISNIPIDKFSAERMEKTRLELVGERDAVKELLPERKIAKFTAPTTKFAK